MFAQYIKAVTGFLESITQRSQGAIHVSGHGMTSRLFIPEDEGSIAYVQSTKLLGMQARKLTLIL